MITPIIEPNKFRFTGADYERLLEMMRKVNASFEGDVYPNSYKHTIEFKVTVHGAWVKDATMSGVAEIVYDYVNFEDATITPNNQE